MSAGLFDLAGYPIQRQDSATVQSPAEAAAQAASAQGGFQNQIATLPTVQTPGQMASGLMAPVAQSYLDLFNNAGFNFGPNELSTITNALGNTFQNAADPTTAAAAVGGSGNWDDWNNYYQNGFATATDKYNTQVSGINQAASLQAQADAQRAQEAEANRQVQQTAYNGIFGGDASGGGALGGVLPGTTQTPSSASAPTTTGGFGSAGMMSTLGNDFGAGAVSNLGLGSVPSATGAATAG